MVCVFEDEYRAGGLRVEQLRINAYSYQAVFQETIEKKIPSTPLSGGAKSTIEIYGNRHQDRDKEEPRDNGEDGMLTRPNCAWKVREMILFNGLCIFYCGRGCVSLESE